MSNYDTVQRQAQAAADQIRAMQSIPAEPPTDMQTHIQRAADVAARLYQVQGSLTALIGRLYGEGQSGKDEGPKPNPVGLSHELTGAISSIEAIAEVLETAAARLGRLA